MYVSTVILLTAIFGLCLDITASTPIHDNTLGVTECQDGLTDLISGYLSPTEGVLSTECTRIVSDFDDLMSHCRPSDPVAINTLIRQLLFIYSENSCDINTLQTASGTAHGLTCYSSIIESNGLKCTTEVRDSAVECLESSSSEGKLRYILSQSMSDICGQAPSCKTPYGVFTTLPGCTSYVWTTNGRDHTIQSAPGTKFSTTFCQPVHANEVFC